MKTMTLLKTMAVVPVVLLGTAGNGAAQISASETANTNNTSNWTAFNSTFVIKDIHGQVFKSWLNADGTFERWNTAPNGIHKKGTWRTLENSVCFTVIEPKPEPMICFPNDRKPHSVGDSWQDADEHGNPTTVTMIPGRDKE